MRLLLVLAMAIFLYSPAYAAFIGSGDDSSASTVQTAKNMRDDSRVTLIGNIISRIGGDKYVFKDATGEITVEIDDKYFYGREVTPQNTVRITGEVDKDFGKATEIDVNRLEILK